jgi:hypothetical protein
MRAHFWIFACVVLLPLSAFADTPADFSGEWVVSGGDQPKTDSTSAADSKPRGGSSGMGGHGGGHGGMGGGGMGGGMSGGHRGRHTQAADSGAAGANVAASSVDPRLDAQALIIRQSDVVFDIAADGRRMAYRFDNRNNYGATYGGTVALSWATPELVIEAHPDTGGSIEEHYSLSPDGKKLTLRIRQQHDNADDAHETTRVFVRNADAARASPANQPTLPP